MKIEQLHSETTDKIIALLRAGTKPWSPSWSQTSVISRPVRSNGQPYHGINVLLLWIAAMEKDFSHRAWYTYRQASALGGQVRRGERGTPVIAYKPADPDVEDDDPRARAFARCYTVFNKEQIDGLEADPSLPQSSARSDLRAMIAYRSLMDHHSPRHVETPGRAFYSPTTDTVHWPCQADFRSPTHHFATACHEMAHWTGHASRLDRRGISGTPSQEAYAYEELIAELASAFIGATVGVDGSHLDDHASYLDSWVRVLADPRAIFRAASEAERASNFLFPQSLVAGLSEGEICDAAA